MKEINIIIFVILIFTINDVFCDEPPIEAEESAVADAVCNEGKGFEYKSCGPVCQTTCDPSMLFCKTVSKKETCVRGCFCKEGLILHRPSQTCVKAEDCRTTCPPEMVFKECGTACPPTCLKPKIKTCREDCVSGCFCSPDMVREVKTNRCLYPEECPKQCPENMEYKDCGPVFPLNCFPMPYNEIYHKECIIGCFCIEGYALHHNTCINITSCPRMNCPPDMEYKKCIKNCPPTCRFRSTNENCFDECTSGCVCKEGLVYNKEQDKCVKVEECTSLCPENMEYSDCVSACPASCKNQKGDPNCKKPCAKGCRCVKGLVLDTSNQACVLPGDCPEDCPNCPKWVYGIDGSE